MTRGPQVAVQVEALSKSYGTLQAVRQVSFEVDHGEVFALLGVNGAAKTTTVEISEGSHARDAGAVSVLGHDWAGRPRALRKRRAIVLQELAVEPNLTVREVLALGDES
ncbi:MAG: ATP-binding cassette domain-containing protein [Actinomycetota bacterium]|nr:ATP-binding cassette domain-containing protein [Actinomycetota bacterium]